MRQTLNAVLEHAGRRWLSAEETLIAPKGFEQSPRAPAKTPVSQSDSAPNDENTTIDADLARRIQAGPKLSAETRATILREAGL